MAPESTPGSTPQIIACSFRTKEFFLGKASTGEVWFNQTSLTITQHKENSVGLGRVELPTSPLSGVRSNQLSYRPNYSVNQWSLNGRLDLTLLATQRQGGVL